MFFRSMVASALVGVGLLSAAYAEPVTLKITCRTKGVELQNTQKAVDEWCKKTGNKVEIVNLPHSSNECLTLTQQLLSTQSSEVDIFQIDTTWVSSLEDHLVDLSPNVSKETMEDYFPSIVKNNTINGKFLALPIYADVGLLYYRKDLLEKYKKKVPSNVEELTGIAIEIQREERKHGNDRIWGYVFQAKSFEGFMCNIVEWIDSFGGNIIDDKGNAVIKSRESVAAIKVASAWVDYISPMGVLNYTEEDCRGVFQSGNAVFMRNWPYAWALANGKDSPVNGKIGISPLPKGVGEKSKATGVLAGWGLSVSKYSKHPKEAIDLALFLTNKDRQKTRCLEASYSPAFMSLYNDKEILEKLPFMKIVYESLQRSVPRPSAKVGKKYNELSSEITNSIHEVLQNKGEKIEESMYNLNKKIEEIIKSVSSSK